MSSPLIRLLDEGTTGMRERDRARDVLEILPKPDAATSHAKGKVWAKLRRPVRRRIPVPFRVLAFAMLLLASAAFAENRIHFLGSFTSLSLHSGSENAGALASAGAASNPPLPTAIAATQPISTVDTAPVPVPSVSAQPAVEAEQPVIATFRAPLPTSGRVSGTPSTPSAAHAAATAGATASAPVAVEAPEAARSMEEAEVVLDGLRALRKEGDPARAYNLFTHYLAKHPTGMLVEDAMGYRMEAADRMGSLTGPALAESYLKAYPRGRYLMLAKRLRPSDGALPLER